MYKERIIAIMSTVFEQGIDEGSSVDSVDLWDSIHHMRLIVEIEKEFDISIDDDDTINMINFKLIELIINEQKEL